MKREICVRAENGIPIYSYTNEHSGSFFISLFVKAGSMYENEKNNGITHFLEHIAIRNVNHIMNGELYALLDKYAIEFNASSYSEMVQFYMCGASCNFSVAAQIFSKLLMPISLPKEEIEAERKRIKAEIREVNDRTSLSALTQSKVWEGSSLSRQITGSAATVSKVTANGLEKYRKEIFSPNNMFFYVTGNVTDDSLNELCREVGKYPLHSTLSHSNKAPVPAAFFKRDAAVYLKNADFTRVSYTFDIDMSRVSVPEVDLIYDIILGGYSSRFFIEMSERRGLFYDLNGSVERYANVGTLSFTYEVKEQNLIDATRLTVEILSSFKTDLLPEDKCMKASYVDNAMMLYDDSRELNFTLGYDNHILNRAYGSLDDRRRAYSDVTPERLRDIARIIFDKDNLTFTMKGKKKKTDLDKIREILRGV